MENNEVNVQEFAQSQGYTVIGQVGVKTVFKDAGGNNIMMSQSDMAKKAIVSAEMQEKQVKADWAKAQRERMREERIAETAKQHEQKNLRNEMYLKARRAEIEMARKKAGF